MALIPGQSLEPLDHWPGSRPTGPIRGSGSGCEAALQASQQVAAVAVPASTPASTAARRYCRDGDSGDAAAPARSLHSRSDAAAAVGPMALILRIGRAFAGLTRWPGSWPVR